MSRLLPLRDPSVETGIKSSYKGTRFRIRVLDRGFPLFPWRLSNLNRGQGRARSLAPQTGVTMTLFTSLSFGHTPLQSSPRPSSGRPRFLVRPVPTPSRSETRLLGQPQV